MTKIAHITYMLLFMLFLLSPILAVMLGSLTETRYVAFPPQGLTLNWYAAALGARESMIAFSLSLLIAILAATFSVLLSLPIGLAIIRFKTSLNGVLFLMVMSVAMLPSVFLGLALLIYYSYIGIGATRLGLLVGHVMIATPFALSMIMVGLAGLNLSVEQAARSLGAGPFVVLLKVTLPQIAWSIVAAWGFSFMISFGALEISLFLSSSTMVTLPVQIYTALEWSPLDPAITAVSSLLIMVTLLVLMVTIRFVDMDRFLSSRRRS